MTPIPRPGGFRMEVSTRPLVAVGKGVVALGMLAGLFWAFGDCLILVGLAAILLLCERAPAHSFFGDPSPLRAYHALHYP
jgi:hypothetical protein